MSPSERRLSEVLGPGDGPQTPGDSAADSALLARAVELLRAHEPVAVPTETVYGLAARFDDAEALRRVFACKGRPLTDPLIVHVAPLGAEPVAALHALGVVDETRLSVRARALVTALAEAFWPGPLTLVLPRGARVPDLATAGLDTVAVRVPRHPLTLALLAAVGAPLCAPSANRFGRVSPTDAEAVRKELGSRVALVLDGGPCAVGVESTVVRVAHDGARLTLLRPGGVSAEALCVVAGEDVIIEAARGDGGGPGAQPSPGLLESHYAPSKPVVRLTSAGPSELVAEVVRAMSRSPARSMAVLLPEGDGDALEHELRSALGPASEVTLAVLSPRGDDHEAARRLFAVLRELDESACERLFVAPCARGSGLWRAIDDRLRRAAAPRGA